MILSTQIKKVALLAAAFSLTFPAFAQDAKKAADKAESATQDAHHGHDHAKEKTDAAKTETTKQTKAAAPDKAKAAGAEAAVKELKIVDVKAGTGAEAVAGKKVTVHYRGQFLDGKEFDSSFSRNTPFTFTLGQGQVIKGWDEGVKGMKVGGKRQLLIPPHLAYGERGAGNVIPPNSPLKFDVELLGVQ